jgi:hypothetical protein
MHTTNRILSRMIAGALLTGGVATGGLELAPGSAQGASGLMPLVWQMDDPDDQPPPPEPAPPPPPPPPRQCWALFLPAPCPPAHG